MKKIALAVAGLALAPALLSTSAFADSPGRLSSGANLYQVRNVTQNVPKDDYAATVAATCGDTVKFSVMIANSNFGSLTDVTVKAPINGTVTVTANNGVETVSSTGKATVTTDKGTLSYVAGTAVLRDANGGTLAKLDDSLVTTGTKTGVTLNGSTQEFVQYQAKVDCPVAPTPTPTTTPTPTPETPTTTPAPLPSTGAGDMILPALGLAGLAAAAAYAVRARRSTRA